MQPAFSATAIDATGTRRWPPTGDRRDTRRRGAPRLAGTWVLSLLVLALLCLASLAIGAKTISLDTVFGALAHGGHSDDDLIVTSLRVPRTILALLAGAGLGVAGGLIQAFTRNPLADPGILGVNAGASLAVVIGIVFLGAESVGQYLWLALGGAILTTVAVYGIGASGRSGASAVRVTLTGVGVAAVLSGITSMITLGHPETFGGTLAWSAGSLAGIPLSVCGQIAPFIAAGLILTALITRDLNALDLGDDLAASLGSRASIIRVLAIVAVTLLAGAATAAVGPIAFVGLMIPRVSRWICGADQRWIFAYSLTLGPCLMLASDILGRIIIEPSELPVGLVTAFVGAPVLVILARSRTVSGL